MINAETEPAPAVDQSVYPLSYMQQGLWIEHQLAPENVAYHVAMAMRILSAVDLAALHQTFQILVDRHAALRTIFPIRDGQPVQQIQEKVSVAFTQIDATGWHEDALRAEVLATHRRPYDLSGGPLFRVDLFTQATDEHVLLIAAHHMVLDGQSLWKLLEEVRLLYSALYSKGTQGEAQHAESSTVGGRYVDYIARQSEMLQRKGEELRAYWQTQLANVPPLLELPTDYVRPPTRQFDGATEFFSLPSELSQALKRLASSEGSTLYRLLLAAFQVLLHRYSGQDDLVVGTPTGRPTWRHFSHTLGYFSNLIPLRANLADNPTFKDFLRQVVQTVFRSLIHKEYPFPLLIQQLDLPHTANVSPLVQVLLNYPQPEPKMAPFFITVPGEEQNTGRLNWGELTIAPFGLPQQEGAFDLILEMVEGTETLLGALKYNTALFRADTIQRMAGHFQTLLEGIVANPEQGVADLPLLTETERHQLLVEWNATTPAASRPTVRDTPADYPSPPDLSRGTREQGFCSGGQRIKGGRCIHQLFELQVERTPEAIAVVAGSLKLTYRELNVKVNQLAHYLIAQGDVPDVRVAICVERELSMVVGLLAILKAGGAYVPLDPTYPKPRLAFMLQQAQVRLLLTQQRLVAHLPSQEVPILCIDADWEAVTHHSPKNPTPAVSDENLIYVIYTSGSTGKPKGAGVYHQGFTNLLNWFTTEFKLNADDSVLLISSLSFDLTQKNIFAPLLLGGSLHLIKDYDPRQIVNYIFAHKISWINCTPSAFYPLIEYDDGHSLMQLDSLRYLFLGGEPISVSRLERWMSSCATKIVNTYGPTECTDICAYYLVDKERLDRRVPIGKPIYNVQLFILDRHQRLVPRGVVGELYIGGVGVGAGYINDRQLSSQKFVRRSFPGVPNPFGEGDALSLSKGRLYKTGDLCRYLPPQTCPEERGYRGGGGLRRGGNIEFLGRIDHQVKIRGFRIELGEIEALLSQHSAIREAIVIVHEREVPSGHSKQLVAVLVPQQAGLQTNTIRSYLKQNLPDYMVPALFVILDHLPLTPNGKVDRRALSELIPRSQELMRSFMPPRDKLERELVQMWQKLLDVCPIGIQDNFFELGGNSLFIIRFLNQLEKELGEDLAPATIFRNPTIEQLANFIKSQP